MSIDITIHMLMITLYIPIKLTAVLMSACTSAAGRHMHKALPEKFWWFSVGGVHPGQWVAAIAEP